MKKTWVAVALALFVAAGIAFAVTPNGPSADNGLNKGESETMHLYLYEKDPTTWKPVEKGAWGKLTYNEETGKFVFNGHGLMDDTDYTLIYYGMLMNGTVMQNDVWPYAYCIASGEAYGGNVNIKGNFPYFEMFSDDSIKEKFWLVTEDDVDCSAGMFLAWNPTSYLFEYNTI